MTTSSRNSSLALRNIRIICSVIFVAGIAGMIITSIAGNNVGARQHDRRHDCNFFTRIIGRNNQFKYNTPRRFR